MSDEEFRQTVRIGNIYNGDVYFDWGASIGFGQLSFNVDETGKITIENECMSKETCRQILYAFVDKIVDEGELDCE
jgi:hypothetical protein